MSSSAPALLFIWQCPVLSMRQFFRARFSTFEAAATPTGSRWQVLTLLLWCRLAVVGLARGNIYDGLGQLIGIAGALLALGFLIAHAWKMAAFWEGFNPN